MTMGEVQRQALARDLARRQQIASHDELRVIDRVLMVLEKSRDAPGPPGLVVVELVDAVRADLAAEDRNRAQLRRDARVEMLGDVGGEG